MRIKLTHEIQTPNIDLASIPQRQYRSFMKNNVGRFVWVLLFFATFVMPTQGHAQDELAVFAVVSEPPKDKTRVSAKAVIDGAVSDTKLLPNETVLGNPIWRTLEICHAMKLEGSKTADGFRVNSVRILDASMLPMTLQGFAGDCLIKKAVDIAPLVD